jgi:D-alanyl-D-alanine-carboxypeptidase/D-alanyl-D-alanine-endopeptidase
MPDPLHAEIDALLETFARDEAIPGLVAGVVRGGRLSHVTAIGRADIEGGKAVGPETAFRIASMTKNVVALAILALRDEGRLTLDAPVADYIPAFAGLRPPTADSRPVSVRDLLCHIAGFISDDSWGDRELGMTPAELDALIEGAALFARPPELSFDYSNLGYALLGRVITNVTGRPYQAFIRQRLLEPLGMARTTFDAHAAADGDFAWGYRQDDGVFSRERLEPDGEFGAMGGLVTTAPDYARYVAFLLAAWPPRDEADTGPVRRSSVRELSLFHGPPLTPRPGPVPEASAYGFGLIQTVGGPLGRRLHHAGGLPGYGSHVLMLPDSGVGVFAFGNRTYAPMDRITLRMARLVHDALPARPGGEPSAAFRAAAEAIAHAYAAGAIEAAAPLLAANVLLDTWPAHRNAELAALRRRVGEGRLTSLEPADALSGDFVLTCAKGRVRGTLSLTPEPQPRIQALTLTPEFD